MKTTRTCHVCVGLTLWVLLHGVVGLSRPSAIVLEDNQYKNILVAINDNVADDPSIVQKIKETFTKASAYLYSATQQRAVFRDVTILVPASWSNANNVYSAATSQVFNNADVIFSAPVSPAPSPQHSRTTRSANSSQWPPFPQGAARTKSYAGCGHPGIRVTLTTDVLTNRRLVGTLGPPEKVLVHEWAQFRWGVFDEFALEGEPQFYFSPTTGKLEGVRCTETIQGIISRIDPVTSRIIYCRDLDPTTGLYPEGCTFKPYPAGPQTTGIVASIMDHVNVRPISKFCDDSSDDATRHNYDAPSRHNRLCAHRSTWDVISTSDDFNNNANPPQSGLDTNPIFHVVQAATSRRLVLALDTSQSMADDMKLTRVRQAVATFVQEGVAPSTQVGLTTFSDKPRTKRIPEALNTPQDRQSFADDLPDTEGGATDITLALTASAKAGGGHVVVVTDGRQTSGQTLTSAVPELRARGVVVSFIVLGGPPHPDLEHLALQTGGQVYSDSNDHVSTATTDALFDLLTTVNPPASTMPTQILSRAQGLPQHHSLSGSFLIDPLLRINTVVLVTYDITVPDVSVQSPSGRVYSHLYPEYVLDTRLNMAIIRVPSIAETGRWRYNVTNKGGYQRLAMLVLSSPANNSVQPVRLQGSLVPVKRTSHNSLNIFAEATRGEQPVLGLRVTALVSVPNGSWEEVVLLDNGAGADIVEGDGVYSRFFSHLHDEGLYTVRVSATGYYRPHPAMGTAHIISDNRFVQRSLSLGYLVVKSNKNNTRAQATSGRGSEDREPPVRIADLRVVKTWGANRTVVLSWRASGDDADRDSASIYEVYMAPTAFDLMKGTSHVTSLSQNEVIHGSLTSPKPFGSREFYMVQIPLELAAANNGTFVFTVLAVDEAGNKGEHSNYVTVGLGRAADVTDMTYWERQTFQPADPALRAPDDQRLLIACVLGSVSGLLVLVIIVTVLVALWGSKVKDTPVLPATVSDLAKSRNSTDLRHNKRNIFALT